MIGILLCSALTFFYGTAYTLHSLKKRRYAASVVSAVLGGVLAGLSALLFWLRMR